MKNTAYCFDLDGTLTNEEILPLLSRETGLFEEISALTQATLAGTINFEASLKLRCKLLSEIPISRVQHIISTIKLHERILYFIKQHSSQCYIITGNLDVWVKELLKKIGCSFFASTAKYNLDTLVGMDKILIKSQAISSLRKTYSKIVAVGDSMNDVSMFEAADIGIAYGGVHNPTESLIDCARYVVFSEEALCHILSTQ